MTTPDRTPRPRSGRVQSVDRAVALLHAIASAPAGAASLRALADRCAINRSTAWRLLATLEDHGLVERDPRTNTYQVGGSAARLAGAAGTVGTVRLAHPVIDRLSAHSGETASLAVERRVALVYVHQVAPPALATPDWLGRQASLHATSAGKAYLAWLPDEEVGNLLPPRLERHTSTTITAPAAVRRELARVRARGYATCMGELEPTSWGVSAPVLDAAGRPLAVVSTWGPSDRVVQQRFPALGALVTEAARAIAVRLRLPLRAA